MALTLDIDNASTSSLARALGCGVRVLPTMDYTGILAWPVRDRFLGLQVNKKGSKIANKVYIQKGLNICQLGL